jgi:hypothetical protein
MLVIRPLIAAPHGLGHAASTSPNYRDIAASATAAYLHLLTGARLRRGGATVALDALNRVGLTIDTDDHETALETAIRTTPPLHLKPIPRP